MRPGAGEQGGEDPAPPAHPGCSRSWGTRREPIKSRCVFSGIPVACLGGAGPFLPARGSWGLNCTLTRGGGVLLPRPPWGSETETESSSPGVSDTWCPGLGDMEPAAQRIGQEPWRLLIHSPVALAKWGGPL